MAPSSVLREQLYSLCLTRAKYTRLKYEQKFCVGCGSYLTLVPKLHLMRCFRLKNQINTRRSSDNISCVFLLLTRFPGERVFVYPQFRSCH